MRRRDLFGLVAMVFAPKPPLVLRAMAEPEPLLLLAGATLYQSHYPWRGPEWGDAWTAF